MSKSTCKAQPVLLTTIRFLLFTDQIFLAETQGKTPLTAEVHQMALVQELI